MIQLIAVCAFGCNNMGCEHVLQENTLPSAESKYAPWTESELAFIKDTQDETLTDVALALGRTYYATSKTRSLVKRGILKA
jgi:hypothetical protein